MGNVLHGVITLEATCMQLEVRSSQDIVRVFFSEVVAEDHNSASETSLARRLSIRE